DVVHEDLIAVLRRPLSAEVDHCTCVRMAAADVVAAVAIGLIPLIADPVPVLRDRLDVGVGIWIEMLPGLPVVAGTVDDVKQVRNDTTRQKGLAAIVEVHAPRVARTVGENLELVPRRVIAPDAGIDGRAFFFGGARFSNARVSEDAMASIEPSIRAPGEAVERFVCVFVMPAVEQDLWFAVRLVVVVFVGN